MQPGSFDGSRNAIGRLLAAYARVQARTGGVPRRGDLDFAELKPLLGWEFFAEWVAPDSIVVRLSGSHIDYVLGSNVTGVNFFEKYRPEQRRLYSRFYGAIADHPCGGYSVRRVIVGGAEAYQYHSIYLPLAPRPDYVPIVGAVALTGFQRIAPVSVVGGPPDFQDLSRLGGFDIGAGVPTGDLETIDIVRVDAEIDATGDLVLDQAAHDARPLLGRPPTLL